MSVNIVKKAKESFYGAKNDAPLVTLKDATTLYQYVKGTNSSSRYLCVYVGENFNVAVRVKKDGVSMRIEGTGVLSDSAIQAMKLTYHTTHYSTHLKMHSDEQTVACITKTVGALLAVFPSTAKGQEATNLQKVIAHEYSKLK